VRCDAVVRSRICSIALLFWFRVSLGYPCIFSCSFGSRRFHAVGGGRSVVVACVAVAVAVAVGVCNKRSLVISKSAGDSRQNSTSRGKPSLAPEAAHSSGIAVPGIRPTDTRRAHCAVWRREKRDPRLPTGAAESASASNASRPPPSTGSVAGTSASTSASCANTQLVPPARRNPFRFRAVPCPRMRARVLGILVLGIRVLRIRVLRIRVLLRSIGTTIGVDMALGILFRWMSHNHARRHGTARHGTARHDTTRNESLSFLEASCVRVRVPRMNE